MKHRFKSLRNAYDPAGEFGFLHSILSIGVSLTLGLLICVIQRIIAPWRIVRITRINSVHIGHMLLEIDWYLSSRDKNLKWDLFFFTSNNPVNSYLADFARSRMSFVGKTIVFGSYILNRKLPKGDRYIAKIPRESFDFRLLDEAQCHINFDENEEIVGENLLRDLGILDSSKIVCFYIRDGKYHQDRFPDRDFSFSNYRDSNIEDFYPAMEYLTSQGFYVVRMGRSAHSSISLSNDKIVDYCFSNLKSDFADFYISSKCQFAICTDTGMIHFPLLFRKPIGCANIAGLHGLLHTKMVKIVTFKRIKKVKTEETLTLDEIFKSEYNLFKDSQSFSESHLSFVENDPETIAGLAVDMIESMNHVRTDRDESNSFKSIILKYRKIPIYCEVSRAWLKTNKDFLHVNFD